MEGSKMDTKQFLAETDQEILDAKKSILSVKDINSLNDFKGKYLGKKSHLTGYYDSMRQVPVAEKKEFGMLLNKLKVALNTLFLDKEKELNDEALNQRLNKEAIDITLPGYH